MDTLSVFSTVIKKKFFNQKPINSKKKFINGLKKMIKNILFKVKKLI